MIFSYIRPTPRSERIFNALCVGAPILGIPYLLLLVFPALDWGFYGAVKKKHAF